uniref:Uncharacterized protein n=1 Tax=Cannabis sativa TaxID=3483 RepID=A0A803P9B7_CANSA
MLEFSECAATDHGFGSDLIDDEDDGFVEMGLDFEEGLIEGNKVESLVVMIGDRIIDLDPFLVSKYKAS